MLSHNYVRSSINYKVQKNLSIHKINTECSKKLQGNVLIMISNLFIWLQFAFEPNIETHNYIADKEHEQLGLAQRTQLPSSIIVIKYETPIPQQTCFQRPRFRMLYKQQNDCTQQKSTYLSLSKYALCLIRIRFMTESASRLTSSSLLLVAIVHIRSSKDT